MDLLHENTNTHLRAYHRLDIWGCPRRKSTANTDAAICECELLHTSNFGCLFLLRGNREFEQCVAQQPGTWQFFELDQTNNSHSALKQPKKCYGDELLIIG